jgi:hypothetical protein
VKSPELLYVLKKLHFSLGTLQQMVVSTIPQCSSYHSQWMSIVGNLLEFILQKPKSLVMPNVP